VTSTERTLDVDALLAPVAGGNPTGADIRYALVYDKIKNARRTADDKQQGKALLGGADDNLRPEDRAASAREFWLEVQNLLADALISQSKDLQLAVWLLEVKAYTEAFRGIADGLELIRRLIETYWDGLFPPIDEEDDEPLALRVGVLEWLNERLPGIIKGLPLSGGSRKYSLADFELSQKATGERARAELAEAGRPTSEQFAQAMSNSNVQHLEVLSASLDTCTSQLAQLEQVTDLKFVTRIPEGSPNRPAILVGFTEVRKALEDCNFQVGRALRAKGPRITTTPVPGATGATDIPASTGDGIWDRALQLVMQGQLEGLRLAQDHIDAAACGRERFLRQLQLSELCIQAGMHAFAYPILDELGKTVDARDLANWEDTDLIRRTWSGLASVCKPLARLRPESVAREADAQSRLNALVSSSAPPPVDDSNQA
jgi:type VI secretion system protein ImpA